MLFCVLLLLMILSSPVLPATTSASTEVPMVSTDRRLSGFDTIRHVQRNHHGLAAQAESISHWSAYYTVNPILLINIVKARSSREELTPQSIKSLAGSLGALAAQRARGAQIEASSPQSLAAELGGLYSLTVDVASEVLDLTRAETAAAGLTARIEVATDIPPALDLPFNQPQSWQFNGVHTWTGDDDGAPMSSLDFANTWSQGWGDDTSGDWVTAASDGRVNVFSSCFVQVLHDSGWATRYYHLDNLQVTSGQRVLAGDLIGNYANDSEQAICSGGHSNGPHLHFALLKDGQYFSLQDIALSGYLIHPGATSYDAAHDRMWLDKRGQRFYAFGPAIFKEEGDNTIDYRYNGMWFSPDHNGHGLNFEITEYPQEGGSRKTVFIVMYSYDDDGLANYYVGNRDYERWRSDESMIVDMVQTAGGDFTGLSPIDFDDPADVNPAGQVEVRFLDCINAQTELNLDERSSGQPFSHSIDLVKLIGVPDHVCDAASLPLTE